MLTKTRRRRQGTGFWTRRDGAAAAEFAMIILFLTILLITTIEIGRLFHAYQVTEKAVRDGARYLAQQDIDCPGVGTGNGSFTDPRHERIAEHLILTGSMDSADIGGSIAAIDSADLTLGYWGATSSITISVDCLSLNDPAVTGGAFQGIYSAFLFIPVVNVAINSPFDFMIDLWSFGGFSINHRQVGIGNQGFNGLPGGNP